MAAFAAAECTSLPTTIAVRAKAPQAIANFAIASA